MHSIVVAPGARVTNLRTLVNDFYKVWFRIRKDFDPHDVPASIIKSIFLILQIVDQISLIAKPFAQNINLCQKRAEYS